MQSNAKHMMQCSRYGRLLNTWVVRQDTTAQLFADRARLIASSALPALSHGIWTTL